MRQVEKGWLSDMQEEKSTERNATEGAPAPKKEQAVTAQPLIPLAMPSIPEMPKLGTGAESAWASRTGLDITAEDFEDAIGHDADRILRASNAKLPSAWIEGPGAVQLLVEAVKLLLGASAAAKLNQKEVHWVVPKVLPKLKLLLVAPAREGTPGAIEARREGKGPLMFNVSEMLRLAEMEVVSGYRDLFAVEKVATSPIGPAIGIKMGKALDSRVLGGKKEEV
jgi:hypothetical protein